MSGVTVRPGRESDCEDVHQLMTRLAEDTPVTTLEALKKYVLGKCGVAECLVAEVAGRTVGCVIYYYTYSTWEGRSVCMEEPAVAPGDGEREVALALWKEVVKVGLSVGCSRCNVTSVGGVDWCVSQGATDLTRAEGWHLFRMDHKAMLAFIQGDKPPEGVRVRESTPQDCDDVRRQIQDLADYEKMPDGPQIDSSTLKEDGYGSKVFYKSFVAECEGEVVGYTLFFLTFSREGPGVYMEDLYVAPQFRKRGVGMALWRQVIKAGLAVEGTKCEFAVLDWNKPSIDFYKSKGAFDVTEAQDTHFLRLGKEQMARFTH